MENVVIDVDVVAEVEVDEHGVVVLMDVPDLLLFPLKTPYTIILSWYFTVLTMDLE